MNKTFDHTPYALAHLAGVASPDTRESIGANWLRRVAEATTELLGEIDNDSSWNDVFEGIAERADALVPIYTHERMSLVADLTLWSDESLEDYIGEADMIEMAAWAAYNVAERLIHALIAEAQAE